MASPTSFRPIRWWPALLILGGLGVALAWIWYVEDRQRQDKNIQTLIAAFVAFALGALWWLLLSRTRWRVRLAVLGATLSALAALASLLRIRGVTGDLVPVLGWRWKSPGAKIPVQPQFSGPTHQTGPEPATAHEAWEGRVPPRPTPDAENGLALPPKAQFMPNYPQFLGPGRNATVSGPALARHWDSDPPVMLWRHPIGAAWSGFAVSGRWAVTQEQRAEKELVACYELLTGRPVWSHADTTRYATTLAGEGPRATPTLDEGRVYALGATGILNCLDLATGRRLWTKDILQDNNTSTNEWGMSGSPLVVDHLVVVSAGGRKGRSLVAYHKMTGEQVWAAGNDRAGYSSPVLATLASRRQILIFNAGGLAAHELAAGQILWQYPWPKNHPHVAVPVLIPGDRVLLSSGYGTGSELLQVTAGTDERWQAARLWKSLRLKAKFTNLVYHEGHVYGLDDGILACLDATTGELKWKEGRYGHGQVILAGPLLLIMAESGEVVLLEPVPREHRELGRFRALKGKTWNPPALAGERLLVRNDQEAACYRLPVENR